MLSSHVSKDGSPKVVAECDLPLTGVRCVTRIYSDLAIIDVTADGLLVTAILNGLSFDELQAKSAAKLQRAAEVGLLRSSQT